MLTRLGRFVVHHRKLVLLGAAVFFVAATVVSSGVVSKLVNGGFENPSSESYRAAEALEDTFGQSDPNFVLLVDTRAGVDVDDPAVAEAGRALTEEVAAEPAIEEAISYWSLGSAPPLKSENGTQALVLAVIRGHQDEMLDAVDELSPKYQRDDGAIRVRVGGMAEMFRQLNHEVESDLVTAETIAFPVTLVLLLVVFGSLVAAGLPLIVGALAIVGTLLVLSIVGSVTDVSIFALNLTTMMGLGLAIDYSLFVVSRFREELHRGLDPHAAAVRTVETAGKTVAFSALTVAISLAALVVFPLGFLSSFAYAGVAVALVCAAGAVIVLPALLAILGPKVDALRIIRRRTRPEHRGIWHRAATFVMRRPWPIAIGIIAFLLVLGAPFLHIKIGLPDDRILPVGMSSREVAEDIRANFASQEAGALQVVAVSAGDPTDPKTAASIENYAAELSRLDNVARVDAATGSYSDGQLLFPATELSGRFVEGEATWLSVVPTVDPLSDQGEQLARDVRASDRPFDVLVAGPSAEVIDSRASLFSRMPLAAVLIAIVTFVLLFLMFGGVLVPIKALVINVLSLSATFGAMVFIFQDGHLAGLLGFTPTGSIVATLPILMFCVAFGLSMDYEVFLLSRIKEEYDRTGDNTRSVALGLERSGGIVTAAALLISLVFGAFSISGVVFVKMFGIGLALAVMMDAFVIRATLVPAFMRLAGKANWWAPRPLRWVYRRFGIHDAEPPAEPEPDREPVGVP